VVNFKLVALAANASSQTISNCVAKRLDNAEVVSIQLAENQEGQREALLEVKTSCHFQM
jgi:hypothetical protein